MNGGLGRDDKAGAGRPHHNPKVGARYAVPMTDNVTLEKRGPWLLIVGALFMVGLGFGFAVLTLSDAVLLDVIFTHDPRWVGVSVGSDVVSSG